MLWEELAPPSHACTMGSPVADRHQNLQQCPRRRGKSSPDLLFSVGFFQLPSTPGWGVGWQGAVVKDMSVLLAVL